MRPYLAAGPVAPQDWSDRPVWIIGGGPSAKGQPLELLAERRTLAINDSAVRLPFTATALWSIDHNWIAHRSRDGFLAGFKGERWLGLHADYDSYPEAIEGVRYVKLRRGLKARGLSRDPEWCHSHGNSGESGINFATLRGARDIFLVGFDMTDARGSHWHGQYAWRPIGNHKHYRGWVEYMDQIAADAASAGIRLFNLSPFSAIKCLPSLTFQEALESDAP